MRPPAGEAAEPLSEDERRARLAPLAAGISLLAPGLGHLLIGARARALLWLTGWIVLAIVRGAVHGPVVVVLMVAAAIDAHLYARPRPSDEPASSAEPGRSAG